MSEITPNFTELLNAAQKVVEDKYLYKKFIEGKPLQNDVPVWMAEFARAWMAEIYGHYLEKCDEVKSVTKVLEWQKEANTRIHNEKREMQSIIDGQHAVLIRLRHEIFHGGVDEINTIMDKALALTQQQTGGAVITKKADAPWQGSASMASDFGISIDQLRDKE